MENKIYTDTSSHLINIKPRLVRCPRCKQEVETDLPNPKCSDCKLQMVTQLFKD